MENKYYIPKIEEFHVGFEYEEFYSRNWKIKTLDITNIKEGSQGGNDFEEVIDYIENKQIRVKYLDGQDLEDLGFTTYDDSTYDRGQYQIDFDRLQRKEGQGVGIVIYNDVPEIVFSGYIKNKSELKRLLEQLD